jgi:peptide/nickel transport system permease protein
MASGALDLPREGARPSGRPSERQVPAASTWTRLRADRTFWLGFCGLLVLCAAAATAPLIAPADPSHAFRDGGLTAAGDPVGPSERFPLGTDSLGRDYASRLLFGARVSLLVGVAAALAAATVGVAIGAIAALAGTVAVGGRRTFFGRRFSVVLPVESFLMRATDAVLALPIVLIAIALVGIGRASLLLTVAVIAAFMWTPMARIVYVRVKSLMQTPYVDAARAIGVSPGGILRRHILPAVAPLVLAYVPLGVAAAILFEATLSYLGIGVPAPAPSWGSMIAEHRSYYASDPRLLVLPGAAIMLTVLSLNLVGDAASDAVDPRRGRA